MDSEIIGRLLAGVEHECTRKASPNVSWEERTKDFNRILDEDMQCAARRQESVESSGCHGRALRYRDRHIGVNRNAERFRVPPVVDDWPRDGWL